MGWQAFLVKGLMDVSFSLEDTHQIAEQMLHVRLKKGQQLFRRKRQVH
jgi:hypothetical protein